MKTRRITTKCERCHGTGAVGLYGDDACPICEGRKVVGVEPDDPLTSPFDAYQNEEWKFWPSKPGQFDEPRLYMEHVDGMPSKYRGRAARLLLDGLAHALARCEESATPPPDSDLVPILDAVRERRFADVRKMIGDLEAEARAESTELDLPTT